MTIELKALGRTPWFPVAIPPARSGVYEVEWADGRPVHAKFARGIWHYGSHRGIDHANSKKSFDATNPPKRWRGLAKDPKVAA